MALNFDELRQVFFEEEHEQNEQKNQLERIKQEHERTKQQLQQARIELLQAKDRRQQEQAEKRQIQAQKQQQADNLTYITSITITFISILASIILFITIILKG